MDEARDVLQKAHAHLHELVARVEALRDLKGDPGALRRQLAWMLNRLTVAYTWEHAEWMDVHVVAPLRTGPHAHEAGICRALQRREQVRELLVWPRRLLRSDAADLQVWAALTILHAALRLVMDDEARVLLPTLRMQLGIQTVDDLVVSGLQAPAVPRPAAALSYPAARGALPVSPAGAAATTANVPALPTRNPAEATHAGSALRTGL